MPVIKIITGSIRPQRFNIQPAEWIMDVTSTKDGIEAELLDLEEINLPFLDEPMPPMQQHYIQDHTKRWAAMVDEADGFVMVTPEYNHSYSPVLKNAIDYLFVEWNYKPVVFVSYGSMAGGARAVEHLRNVVSEVRMYDLREQVLIPNYWESLDENGKYQFSAKENEAASEMIGNLSFWADYMKAAREELRKKITVS